MPDEFARLAGWWNNGLTLSEKRLLCIAGGVDVVAVDIKRWEWLEQEQRFGISAGLRRLNALALEWMHLAR